MNSSVYIFGKFTSGYTQYPDEDFSSSIFNKIYQNSKAISQIAIHRDGNLIYYTYIRKLIKNQYIGLCVLLNDALITDLKNLFSLFENTISNLAENGYFICYDEYGNLVGNTVKLYCKTEEIDAITNSLRQAFKALAKTAKRLPPENYAVSKNSSKSFTVEDSEDAILYSSYTNGFTYIYKSKDFDTTQMSRYQAVLAKVSGERDQLSKQLDEKKSEVYRLKAKQRNMTWVGLLGLIVLIFGVILWNKVLFPSEVTHYETGEFVYYGPLQDKKPHGIGVAIYPKNDPDERKYYIGNFVNGQRQDSLAILFYTKGDYFYGNMEGDKWKEGLFYSHSDGTYYIGTFDENNKPKDGEWYKYKKAYSMRNGKRID